MSDARADLPDLRPLFAPLGPAEFFATYWQRRMLFHQLEPAILAEVAREVGPLDVTRFAGLARGGTQAWLTGEEVAHSVLPVDAATVEKALGIGATLYFIDLPLDRLKRGLAALIGTRPHNIIASLFVTPAGGGTSWHFDANENFTVQLTGIKRWQVAEAPTVEAAPESYIAGLHVPGALAGLMGELRQEPARTVDMVPGSFLYVPRGVMHRTETPEASWSLNLSYRAMWVDMVCDGLKARLAASPRWRASVTGVGEGSDPGARAASMLPELIAELRRLLDDPAERKELERRFLDPADRDGG
jgi:50S ribosomal protein L16 3-hydroxylase